MLLAFPNGYLNLKTGEFKKPYREALVTMTCAAEYDPDATSDLWDRTVTRFVPDAAVRTDLFTAYGYCLSGRGKEHMFMPDGPSKCGKSTINAAVMNALGDYAGTVGLESFASSMYETGGRAREDLAALVGKRLIVASEATEHQRLNPAVLKKMLGGTDKISLRKNYGEQYEALPTFGLWILTNYQPKLPADDDAIWERLHVFPFNQYIKPEERDETERDKVVNPAITGSAVLAELLRGWWRFTKEQHGRLSLPTTVNASRDARTAQDLFAQFVAEYCMEGESETVKYDELKRSFRRFLQYENAHETYSDKRIAAILKRRGYEPYKSAGRCYRGISVAKSVPYEWGTS